MAKSSKPSLSLKALNDFYVIEEEPIELTADKGSGLTQEVVSALKEKRIVLPQTAQFYADKFPFRGHVVAKGDKCTYDEIKLGTRVMFARLGGQRWVHDDRQYITIKESDVHAIIN